MTSLARELRSSKLPQRHDRRNVPSPTKPFTTGSLFYANGDASPITKVCRPQAQPAIMSRLFRAPPLPLRRPHPIPAVAPTAPFRPTTRAVSLLPPSRPARPPPPRNRPPRQTKPPAFPPPPRRYATYRDPYGREIRPLLTSGSFGRAARSPNTYLIVGIAVSGAFLFYFSNLETVPVTGRTRFNVYGPDTVREAGEMQYRALLYELEKQGARILPDWDWRALRVKRVMRKLIPFSGMAGEDWEIFVIEDPHTQNAFVLPGGKVFVFSGILPMARTDSALAAVLGHEIAHNVADHVGERMSAAIGTNIILYSSMALVGFLGFGPLLMHWAGSQFLDIAFGNPMSRLQESEADYIGLMMMAEACYDPADAVEFWERMERAKGQEVPEWLSTHPSNMSRIKKIQEWLPKAEEKRQNSDCHTTTAFADLFKRALSRGVIII
ncbi:peptidase family M48-domain-containing protein [Cercophora newfieldiana]|uniref:Peptidase family M48-domain-containing protein n=1 Tax=Cercophora newfieldiana TaxID=92897 RepID=A0AA39Y0Y1_9PEZI|nr:peptidase family M48-domain-containing protein [Cercophora newfieldiana]